MTDEFLECLSSEKQKYIVWKRNFMLSMTFYSAFLTNTYLNAELFKFLVTQTQVYFHFIILLHAPQTV